MLCIKVEKRTKLEGLICLGRIPRPVPALPSYLSALNMYSACSSRLNKD